MLGVRRRRLEDKIGGRTFLGFFLVQDLRQRWHFEVRYPGSNMTIPSLLEADGTKI